MPIRHVPVDELLALLGGAAGSEAWARPWAGEVLVVDLDARLPAGPLPALTSALAKVVVGVTANGPDREHPASSLCDMLLSRDELDLLDHVAEAVVANPVAATALAMLLRGSEERTIDDGLLAESAVYSSLQAGPEFAAWLVAHRQRERPPEQDAVELERSGGSLQITLTRPHVRNALSTLMRDQLADAFDLVALDPSIEEVHLRGRGESFCAGGDLDEFGSFADPSSAHLVRLQQSVGRRIALVAGRVVAHLHGACMGSGIELPAFAGTVRAARSTTIGLPEVAMGLIPGAGGTVSLPRRIGRHRTACLALTGTRLDASTALEWGLVDALDEEA
jgi:enoyl-CoA hydratase/carnithine racemase